MDTQMLNWHAIYERDRDGRILASYECPVTERRSGVIS
jgi:hypothetical protein